MKKVYIMLIGVTVVLNMYLIFGWNPYSNKNNVAVASYENDGSYNELNDNDYKNNKQYGIEEAQVKSFFLNEDKSIESLSDKNIKELDNILNKLSTIDLEKWVLVKNNANNDNVIEFFKIIHKRMSKEDYKKVKDIISEIIDVDRVEQVLKNNYE